MVFGRNVWLIVKKKYEVPSKEKKQWMDFTKNIGELRPKESDFLKEKKNYSKSPKLDLHGNTLDEGNQKVKEFIIKYYSLGYRKLLVVTGKGNRSKTYDNPYISENLGVLKNSIPEFIKNDDELKKIIVKISDASLKDGGKGAIYIFLKNSNKIKE